MQMMESEEKIIVGLDIGTTKICAVVGKQNQYGKLEVMGLGRSISEGVIQGIVTNLDKTVRAIKEAVTQSADQSNTTIGIVNVGITGHHISSSVHYDSVFRNSKEEVITSNEANSLTQNMYRIVVPPGCNIIHVMPQNYTVDGQRGIKDPVGMTGSRLEASFNVITAKTEQISNINKCVRKADLEIDQLMLQPIASSLSVLSDDEKEAGVCLVDIGGGTTDIAIFVDGIVRHTSVVPLGGQIITSDIKEGCRVLENQAEDLKVGHGNALPENASLQDFVSIPGLKNRPAKEISRRNLALIIHARLKDIIECVHCAVLASGYKDKLGAGLVITGGGALLSGIQQIFEYMLGLECRIGYPNEHLGRSKLDEIKSPVYATALGLVLSAFRSIDERDMPYISKESDRRQQKPKNFFKNILHKAKDILLENFDDKME